VYELVLCGAKQADIRRAMAVGMRAAALPGILLVSAGNYGGALGKVRYPLYEILREAAEI
jgi:formylmethanofuran--tetrahydromethanopterin N-formyltransferase